MKRNEKKYIQEIEPFFKQMGFNLENKNFFTKSDIDFRYGISFLFNDWSDGLYVKPYLFVEYLPALDIFNKATNLDIPMIYCEAGLILGNDDFEITNENAEILYRINNQEEINDSKVRLQKLYRNEIVPYFERFKSLDYIDKVFNTNPLIFTCSNSRNFHRYSIALILAKLNNRTDYKELENIYEKEISKSSNNKIKDNFYRTKNYLGNYK